jgi:proteasome lid subunit RPN8/RPN11
MRFSILPIIKAEPLRRVIIPEKIWAETWLGLRQRGGGMVESAAVWGGRREESNEIVEAVYYLDDLAGNIQRTGYHRVSTKALEKFFNQLHKDRRVIVGDVHTHPTHWVGLSEIDRDHPIEFRKGLYAVVLPSYAIPAPSLQSAGVHQYKGDGRWRMLRQSEKKKVFTFI